MGIDNFGLIEDSKDTEVFKGQDNNWLTNQEEEEQLKTINGNTQGDIECMAGKYIK